MKKKIEFDVSVRQHLLKGVEILKDAVAVTMGPKGRCVMIERESGKPHVTKDGVTVAKSIELENPFQNIGAQVVKEASAKTAEVAGDGTTTATVLTHAIIDTGLRMVTEGSNPVDIKRGIDLGVKEVIKKLDELSQPVKNTNDIEKIATISANNDKEIGKLISEAMEIVGNDGIVSVENGQKGIIELIQKDGMEFERGLLSPYFKTDQKKNRSVMRQPFVLVCNDSIQTIHEIVGILEQVSQTGRPLFIIADDYEETVLATLILNAIQGKISVCPIKSPGIGDYKRELLLDICAKTGATLVSKALGGELTDVDINKHCGTAHTITVTKENTTIIEGGGSNEVIEDRVKTLEHEISEETSDFVKEKLLERKAKLNGGVVIVSVGAPTETEMKEVRDRVDDAVAATKSAIEGGVVVGGGFALLSCVDSLQKFGDTQEGDVQLGVTSLINAIKAPSKQIIDNTGIDGGKIITEIVEDYNLIESMGYNSKTGKIENLLEAGVLDPTTVVKNAIINASSSAGQILITNCIITNVRE